LCSCVTCTVFAQRPNTGVWAGLQLPVQLNKKWQFHQEGGYRTLGNSISALQYFYRPGIRYRINKNQHIAAGMAFFCTRTSFIKENDAFAKEFRIWEEANYKKDITAKIQGLLRLRTEQRFFAATDAKNAEHAFRYRLKPQLNYTFNFHWTFILADEYFQQYTHNEWLFDQNRFLLNAVYSINSLTQIQAGYMYLHWHTGSAQNIAMLSFIKTISLHGQ
jgi:hypothetical protein